MSSDLLNEDLTTAGGFEPFLKKALSKKEIPAGNILQVQQVINISVPKQDGHQQYDAERQILKVTLTDGEVCVYGLVTEPLQRFSMNTPPGTKIKLLQNVSAHGQLIMMSRINCQVLGGDVPKLIEKWNFQRAMDIKKEWGVMGRIEGTEGPPLWRQFGQKTVPLDVVALRKMKAMDIVNEKKEAAGNDGSKTQFDLQRNEAISELMEKSVKQKWQKPNKHLVDKEVMDIMDEGFSYDEASNALNKFKNPQKAIRFLKASRGELPQPKPNTIDEKRERKKKNPKNNDEEDDAPIPKEYQRPTRNISLFGFIADTINIKEDDPPESETRPSDDYSQNYRGSGRGGRRGYRGGDANPRSRGGQRGQRSYGSDNRIGSQSFQSNNSEGFNSYQEQRSQYNPNYNEDYPRQEKSYGGGGGGHRGGRGRGCDSDRNSSRSYNDSRATNHSSRGGYVKENREYEYDSSRQNPRGGPDRNYSQPPRFQKQTKQHYGSGEEYPVSYNNYNSSFSPSNTQSRASYDDKYQSRGGSGRSNQGGGFQYDQNYQSQSQQYNNSNDSWSSSRTMVFSRSERGGGGGGGGSGGGRGRDYNSGNYYS